jgi:hypothetical protein
VIARLAQAEACESNAHYRDDIRIARLIVHYAATGEAKLCSPHELASYMVLGLHPDNVWPKILERRRALLGSNWEKFWRQLPPKKPPVSAVLGRSQQKLWCEKNIGARAGNSRAGEALVLCDQTNSVPMAAPSIAASYPNSDAPSSGKKGEYSYDQLIDIVERSGAPEHVRNLTLAALVVRGRWPKKQGPVSSVITVSVRSLQDKSGVWRSTIQRRIRRAKQDRYWRELKPMNSWLDCPKCGAERSEAKCPKCEHKGNGLNPNEFRRTFTYAIDIEKFERAQPCRQVREIRLKKAELRQMPAREPATEAPKPEPAPRRQTEQHQKERTVVHTEVMQRATKAAQLLVEMCGLADLGAIPQIAISVAAEAKYRGIEIEEAGKFIAECATRDQKNGIVLTRFYFRDLKWRADGGQQKTAAQGRAERSQQQIAEALRRFNRNPEVDSRADPFDGTQLKE